MLRYFDKAFFRFLLGFAGMISLSFIVLMAVGYYEVEVKNRAAYPEVVEVETAAVLNP